MCVRYPKPNCVPQIELRDVHYAYPSRPNAPALRGVSLSLEPGRLLALVRRTDAPRVIYSG